MLILYISKEKSDYAVIETKMKMLLVKLIKHYENYT